MTTSERLVDKAKEAFVMASGPQTWKTKDGRTLKEIENSETTDENK